MSEARHYGGVGSMASRPWPVPLGLCLALSFLVSACTVSSELSLPIEQQAAHVMGFDENHDSILSSPEVAAQLNPILRRASQ